MFTLARLAFRDDNLTHLILQGLDATNKRNGVEGSARKGNDQKDYKVHFPNILRRMSGQNSFRMLKKASNPICWPYL